MEGRTMIDNVIAVLKMNGVDTDGALERFCGREELYKKYLGKFHEDKNYHGLFECLEKDDYENAIINVHTLKGVSGNLGFSKLMEYSMAMLSDLREGKYDNLEIHSENIREERDRIVALING
ncbi:MAG: Hpt domain-containing protein [Ruminococcus sp.]|nr:Hpt domain-containing protein [Ruminococcus sp.]